MDGERFVYEKEFNKVMGVDANGNNLYKVKVVDFKLFLGGVMGLDIVLFDEKKVGIGLIEIPSSLHHAIFVGTSKWSSYMYLSKVKDYYKTNVQFNQYEISCFVEDLKQIRTFIDSMHHSSLDKLVQSLSDGNVKAIHVAGD